MTAMNILHQLAHLPPHADARLAFFWGVDQGVAVGVEGVSLLRPSVLMIETPADGTVCSL